MDKVDKGPSSARAYYSQDFEWNALREEVERMPEYVAPQDHSIVPSSELPLLPSSDCGEEAPSTSSSWETFHTRHSRNLFFKERRYLTKEFPELLSGQGEAPLVLLEVGCGTGSSVVPIVRENKGALVYACDCSAAALKKATDVVTNCAQASSFTSVSSFHPFLCDVSLCKLPEFLCCSACRRKYIQADPKGSVPELQVNGRTSSHAQFDSNGVGLYTATRGIRSASKGCCAGGLDIVTMIFTLSAIPVERMVHVLHECLQVLKPGGLLLFRDYGLYDMTMLRFAPRQRISSSLYRRDDGTLSYFFSLEVVRALFASVGFWVRELEYCCVQLTNRRKQLPMKRVWVHAKFQKPDHS